MFRKNSILAKQSKLAKAHQKVVVSVNYRLGLLGFYASQEIARKVGSTGGLNGVHDQIVALQFVQQQIESFGGDPSGWFWSSRPQLSH